MKRFIKKKLNKFLPNSLYRCLLYKFRKIRLVLKSFIFLPKYVYWGKAKINTRSWVTANVELWKKKNNFKIYEPETTECLIKLFKDSKCFWDIGAQVGYFSILAAQKGIKTYAFEMNDIFCNEIKKHSDNNSLEINIINNPLGKTSQSICFEAYAGLVKKDAISADDFIKKTGDIPDLIKIDIDGGEYDFLCGAINLLKNNNPKIIMEIIQGEPLIKKINNLGYELVKEMDGSLNGLFIKKQ